MPLYHPPIAEMRFAMAALAAGSAPADDAGAELVDAILEEAGRFASGVLAPLNPAGDRDGARLANGVVTTTPGWQAAYASFVEAGWNGLGFDSDWGGQGLSSLIGAAVQEMWQAANMSFALCPMLTQGAAEAILLHGSAAQQQLYLPRLVSGEWTGTMCLTEPQAGSDLAAVRSRAVPEGGHFRISGQKIYITYGDHDLAPNIVHLVLARTPGAPEGVKGISLFVVPKFLPDAAGEPGVPNDVRCVSLEHKLGIHGSPTAVLAFGDAEGAIGHLVGEEHHGLAYMFTMMNMARLSVGLQGLAVADRAYQRALAFARERRQGRAVGDPSGTSAAIIRHPDVRRMLLGMKARIAAMRSLAYGCAVARDLAHGHADPSERARQQALFELLTPVVKGWCTEWSVQIASTALQVHGGMGYVEETGAAQHYRDARITTIYEGTTGIQAADLVGRKILRDGGVAARDLVGTLRGLLPRLASPFPALSRSLAQGLDDLDGAIAWLIAADSRDRRLPLAAAVPFLDLLGTVVGGHGLFREALHAAALLAEGRGDPAWLEGRLQLARFYASSIMPGTGAAAQSAMEGAQAVVDGGDEAF